MWTKSMKLVQNDDAGKLVKLPELPRKPDLPSDHWSTSDEMAINSMLIGLADLGEEHLLRLSLYIAADQPNNDRAFEMEDRSTWTMKNLNQVGFENGLFALICYAGPQFRLVISLPVGLQKLGGACNNISPFPHFLFPTDKFELTHVGESLVEFKLSSHAFQHGTRDNSKEALQKLLYHIFDEDEAKKSAVNLFSSPIHSVTLPDAVMDIAGIPRHCQFFSFLYPALNAAKSAKIKQELAAKGIVTSDPFVQMLTVGAFVYFDHKYDVAAINAINFEDPGHTTAVLYLSQPCQMPVMAIDPLEEGGRWCEVTAERVRKAGFSHFCWINASEFLGDSIFTEGGGFAYRHAKDRSKSLFYPVVGVTPELHMPGLNRTIKVCQLPAEEMDVCEKFMAAYAEAVAPPQPLLYDAPLHIEEFSSDKVLGGLGESEKFVQSGMMVFADGRLGAMGVAKAMGFEDERDVFTYASSLTGGNEYDKSIKAIQIEVEQAVKREVGKGEWWAAKQEDIDNMNYVLYGEAKETPLDSNDGTGSSVMRDAGNGGKRLADFANMPEAVMSELELIEVAALRLYTTSTFKLINFPLRLGTRPHPLPATTHAITSALKKMRALHLNAADGKFKPRFLWRGMKNRSVPAEFLECGGAEAACLSTSSDLSVVAGYAKSKNPLLFRIRVDSPMELGASIKWLSTFPHEEETLYPPLTFLKPMFEQKIRGIEGGLIVTIKPSFPS